MLRKRIMKTGETILLTGLLCTLVNSATKQLKVPRIYNALITTDQKLQPSQAYPALTPVIQSIHYPVPGYFSTTYNTIVPVPYNAAPGGRSFSYAVKQDYFSYNYYENDIPVATDQHGLFAPATKHFVYGGSPGDAAAKKPPFPFYQYGAPYPIPAAATHQTTFVTDGPPFIGQSPKVLLENPIQFKNLQYSETGASPSEEYDSSTNVVKGDSSLGSQSGTRDHDGNSSEDERHNDQSTDNLVKNNRPQDPSIVDIPPEPLPIGKPKNKKTQEYPPPPSGLFF